MATKLYFGQDVWNTGIKPSIASQWEGTFDEGLIRGRLVTSSFRTDRAAPRVTTQFTDSQATNGARDYCAYQFIVGLNEGQVISGSQSLQAVVYCTRTGNVISLKLCIGVRIIASDGSTVRKELCTPTRDGTNMGTGPTQSRVWDATSAATDYTCQSGDCLVVEIGCGSFAVTNDFSCAIRLGYNSTVCPATDGLADALFDYQGWIEFDDTIASTFESTSASVKMKGGVEIKGGVQIPE